MNIKMNKVLPVVIENYYSQNPSWKVQNWWSWEKYFIEEAEANRIYTLIDLIKSQPKISMASSTMEPVLGPRRSFSLISRRVWMSSSML